MEAADVKFGDVAESLEMTADEKQTLDLRVQAARAVRRKRESMKPSEQELAQRIRIGQSRSH